MASDERFTYLDGGKGGRKARKEAVKAARRAAKRERARAGAAAPATGAADATEAVSSVYVRRETVRAVWREVKRDGGESVSELVEDLLLAWLRERTR